MLLLFPGLKLSTLEVRENYPDPARYWGRCSKRVPYKDVERFISSDGFRELSYFTTSNCFWKFGQGHSHNLPNPDRPGQDWQPSIWDEMSKRRDGAESGAKVRIYRHTKEGAVELKVDFVTARNFDSGQSAASYEPIEVHIKRGRGVDYTQSGRYTMEPEWQRPFIDIFKRFS